MKSIYINERTLVWLEDGTQYDVPNDHPNINPIQKVLTGTQDESEFLSLLDGRKSLADIDTSGLVFEDDGVYFNGDKLHGVLVETIEALIENGFPNLDGMKNFLENLLENESENSIEELYEFLSYKQLPITEDGCFLAYKSVRVDGYSHHGNTKVTVVSGEVNDGGHILNEVGSIIEVPRDEVDDNLSAHCSTGLHVGSLNYAKGFGGGKKLLICKINPKDVVSVPNDYSCQKVRVCRYEVVDSFTEEITEPQVKVESSGVEKSFVDERSSDADKIETYLSNKSQVVDFVTLKQIQSSFSPKTPPILTVLNIINQLPSNGIDFEFEFNANSTGKSVIRFK